MLFYPAALPLSAQTLTYAAGVIRRHRKKIGSAWSKLNPGRQALMVLAYLRNGDTFAELAAGRRRPGADPLPGPQQARLAEGGQPGPRPATIPRRARQRPAQNLAHPAQTSLLPVEGRPVGQGHPRPSGPRDRRMKTLTARQNLELGWRCTIKGFRRSRAESAKDAAL